MTYDSPEPEPEPEPEPTKISVVHLAVGVLGILLALVFGVLTWLTARSNERASIINDLACQVYELGGKPVDAAHCPKRTPTPTPTITHTVIRHGQKVRIVVTPTQRVVVRPSLIPGPTITELAPRPTVTKTKRIRVVVTKTATPQPTLCLPITCMKGKH